MWRGAKRTQKGETYARCTMNKREAVLSSDVCVCVCVCVCVSLARHLSASSPRERERERERERG